MKALEFARLTKKNQYEHIAEQLRQRILSGHWKPGDKLPSTKELSEAFGVGRSTTREALSALKAMGLIDIRQGGCCTVLDPAKAGALAPELDRLLAHGAVFELLEARKALETANAELAAHRRTDDDLERLGRIIQDMAEHKEDEEVSAHLDMSFHAALAQAARNSVMALLFDSIASRVEAAILGTRRVEMYANPSESQKLYKQHLAIYEAVRDRDGRRAKRCMDTHLRHVEAILQKFLAR